MTLDSMLSSLVRTVKVEEEDLGGEWKGNLAAVIFYYRPNVSSFRSIADTSVFSKKR